jgi:hypothetical protein
MTEADWNLAWSRFAFIAALIAIPTVMLSALMARTIGPQPVVFATPVSVSVIIVFLSRRWSALRGLQQAKALPAPAGAGRVFLLVLGPPLQAVLWWLGACVTGMAVVIVPWLLR